MLNTYNYDTNWLYLYSIIFTTLLIFPQGLPRIKLTKIWILFTSLIKNEQFLAHLVPKAGLDVPTFLGGDFIRFTHKNKKVSISTYFGAESRTWTGTILLPRDFKSLASAYSAISAWWRHLSDSNRGSRCCRPLPYHLAKVP